MTLQFFKKMPCPRLSLNSFAFKWCTRASFRWQRFTIAGVKNKEIQSARRPYTQLPQKKKDRCPASEHLSSYMVLFYSIAKIIKITRGFKSLILWRSQWKSVLISGDEERDVEGGAFVDFILRCSKAHLNVGKLFGLAWVRYFLVETLLTL